MIIPFQFPDSQRLSAHSSTIIVWNSKTYVTFFAGTREGGADVAIWLYCMEDHALWKVIDTPEQPNWNPVLFEWDGGLYIVYRFGPTPWSWRNAVVKVDIRGSGPALGQPVEMYGGPIKNKPLLMSNGELIAGFSTEHDGWKSYASILSAPWVWDNREIDSTGIPGRGLIQPTLWESEPGHIHMFMRSAMGWVCRSDSEDYGRTWCPAYSTEIPNNNSGIDVVRWEDNLYLALNPKSEPNMHSHNRRVLEVWKLGLDGVLLPGGHRVLENRQKNGAEYSYPALIRSAHYLLCSYTYERKWIKVRKIDAF